MFSVITAADYFLYSTYTTFLKLAELHLKNRSSTTKKKQWRKKNTALSKIKLFITLGIYHGLRTRQINAYARAQKLKRINSLLNKYY